MGIDYTGWAIASVYTLYVTAWTVWTIQACSWVSHSMIGAGEVSYASWILRNPGMRDTTVLHFLIGAKNSAAFSVRFEMTVEGTRDCVPPNSGYVPLDLAPDWHLLYRRALLRKRLQAQHVQNHKLISGLSVLAQVIPSKINWAPGLCSESSFRVNLKRTHLLGRDLLAMN